MKTSQAFPFYPTDFIFGTMLFSPAQVGGYIRLLCYQWESGQIPAALPSLCRISGCDESDVEVILTKFQHIDGKYLNRRLESVRLERMQYIELQRDKGKKGGRPKSEDVDSGKAPAKPRKSPGLAEPKPSLSQAKPELNPSQTLPSPSPSPSPSLLLSSGFPTNRSEIPEPNNSGPPSKAEALAYIQDRPDLEITTDVVVRWIAARELVDWRVMRRGKFITVDCTNWKSDLVAYANSLRPIPDEELQPQSMPDDPDFGETPDGKLVNEIIAAYQDGTKPWPKLMETRRILLPQVKRGLGPEILEKTKPIAAFLKKWPSEERKFWPSAHSFFSETRWNDPPESYKKVKNYSCF